MENLTLQQLINQTREALIDAGASNYYQNVFKTLTKQLFLYAKEHSTESFSMTGSSETFGAAPRRFVG